MIPSPLSIEAAIRCRVYTEDGRNVDFASVIRENYGAPTIAIFVRHMWCGLCQEYLRALRRIDAKRYAEVGVEVIVIGCGDPALIRRYKGKCAPGVLKSRMGLIICNSDRPRQV